MSVNIAMLVNRLVKIFSKFILSKPLLAKSLFSIPLLAITSFVKSLIKPLAVLTLLTMLTPLITSCEKAQPLNIAYYSWIGYQFPFLSEQTSDDSMLHYRQTADSAESMQLLKSKQVDAAYLTLDEVLLMQDQGVDLTVVLIADISAGADIVLGQSNITNAQEIKNKTIGYEANALGEFMLYHFLKKYQLTKSDVKLVNIDVKNSISAFKNKQIDIVISYYPIAQQLIKLNAVTLFDSQEIPDTIVDVLAIRNQISEQKHHQILDAVKKHFNGVNYLNVNYEDGKYRLASLLDTNAQEIGLSLSHLILPSEQANYRLLNDKAAIKKVLTELTQQMKATGLIQNLSNKKPIFTDEFIQ